MKKVLYISYYRECNTFKSKLKNLLRPQGYGGQDGFFIASLNTVYDVVEKDFEYLYNNYKDCSVKYSAIFINAKIAKTEYLELKAFNCLKYISDSLPKILVISNAQAGDILNENILNLFDIIFKREHYIDLDRYDISSVNKVKIRTTMLCCPQIRVHKQNASKVDVIKLGYKTPSLEDKYDIFFSGGTTSTIREKVVNKIKQYEFNFTGGLQLKPNSSDLAKSLEEKSIKGKRYTKTIRKTKINLALEGYGEFTYRHLELFYFSAFCLSTPSIRGLKLPIDIKEGEHYVCFDNLDDLIDKCKYYLDNDIARNKIALAGRELFEKEYNFNKHGEYILRTVDSI